MAKHLGVDPGKENFALVMLDDAGRVCHAQMLEETISSMKAKDADMRPRYRKAMRILLRRLRPDVVMSEQFAARRFGTQSSEVVNLMLGALSAITDYLRIEDRTTLPSTWKNALGKLTDLDELYAYAKSLGMPPHPVDALCLATFSRGNFSFTQTAVRSLKRGIREVRKLLLVNSPWAIKVKRKKAVKRRGKKK